MTLKVFWVFLCLKVKGAAIACLGKPTYLRIHGEIKRRDETDASRAADPQTSRVMNGFMFGKQKKVPAAGSPECEPEVCDHPAGKIKARSNKRTTSDGRKVGEDWFTCTKCCARWERLPIPTANPAVETSEAEKGHPKGAGKGKGKTKRPLRDHELPTNLRLWKANLEANGLKEVEFGKYKGKTFSDAREDRQYTNWLMKEAMTSISPSPQLADLAAWMQAYDRMEVECEMEMYRFFEHEDLTAPTVPPPVPPPPPPPTRTQAPAEEYRVASDLEEDMSYDEQENDYFRETDFLRVEVSDEEF